MTPEGPFSGLFVLDLTRILAGPYCTMLLSDLGARVVKVEPPQGDESRRYGPFINRVSIRSPSTRTSISGEAPTIASSPSIRQYM